ncbi:MAG: DUF378 domain-containing protein [Alphaproteobacteria bacterium]|nr:DUF378 domain-containing protein [Alphaproteobacteria bacterium]MBN2674924.1 DUF378 domain-containing protein [Alphaproteobacteria bacterium]
MQEIKKYVLNPLIIIGALNWGLVGLLNFDLVAAIFGTGTMLTRTVYSIVGIAALVYIFILMGKKK